MINLEGKSVEELTAIKEALTSVYKDAIFLVLEALRKEEAKRDAYWDGVAEQAKEEAVK